MDTAGVDTAARPSRAVPGRRAGAGARPRKPREAREREARQLVENMNAVLSPLSLQGVPALEALASDIVRFVEEGVPCHGRALHSWNRFTWRLTTVRGVESTVHIQKR